MDGRPVRSSAPMAAVPRGSTRPSPSRNNAGGHSIGVPSSSPSSASLQSHGVASAHLLALQRQYHSANPQLEDDMLSRSHVAVTSPSVTFAPLAHVNSNSSFSDHSRLGGSNSHGGGLGSESFYSDHSHSRSGGGIDPSPLLMGSDASGSSLGNGGGVGSASASAVGGEAHKPVRRFLYDFPPRWALAFARFDNACTKLVQTPLATIGGLTTSLEEEILQSNEMANQEERRRRERSASHSSKNSHDSLHHSSSAPSSTIVSMAITRRNKLLTFLALTVTAFTTIELGCIAPLFLFLIGDDNLATQFLFTTLVCAIISQCFKRFVWRPRPWMEGRAIQVKRDLTSSFPSRAVTCAVVYAYIAAHFFYSPNAVPAYVFIPMVVVAALMAATARIFVGAHYASDCVAGFILGSICCALGSLLNRAVDAGCASCVAGHCYAQSESARLTWHTLDELNLLTIFMTATFALIVVGLFMSSPLHFWNKCVPIFGLLSSCLGFRVTLLCPEHNSSGVALRHMSRPNAGVVLIAILIAAAGFLAAKGASMFVVTTTSTQLSSESELNSEESHSVMAAAHGGGSNAADRLAAFGSHSPLHDASQRLFLQCSSFKGTVRNLAIFLAVYATLYVSLSAWRIHFATR